MMLIVTGVGFLIHLYSTTYMAEDPGYARFFAYLNLFIFSMLVLILGDNLPVLFVGWEGVGLCSLPAHRLLVRGRRRTRRPARRRSSPTASATSACSCAMFLLALLHGRARLERHRQRRDEPACTRARPGRVARLAARRRAATRASSQFLQPNTPVHRQRGDARRPRAASSAAPARARRSRSTSGCPTRWPAPRRSPRSSTRRPWSPPASTSSAALSFVFVLSPVQR